MTHVLDGVSNSNAVFLNEDVLHAVDLNCFPLPFLVNGSSTHEQWILGFTLFLKESFQAVQYLLSDTRPVVVLYFTHADVATC